MVDDITVGLVHIARTAAAEAEICKPVRARSTQEVGQSAGEMTCLPFHWAMPQATLSKMVFSLASLGAEGVAGLQKETLSILEHSREPWASSRYWGAHSGTTTCDDIVSGAPMTPMSARASGTKAHQGAP